MFISGKKADSFIGRFAFESEGDDIFTVYKRPSRPKLQAFNECLKKCADQDGYGFRIMSHNTFGFTCGWLTFVDSGEVILHVETPHNSYEMAY